MLGGIWNSMIVGSSQSNALYKNIGHNIIYYLSN